MIRKLKLNIALTEHARALDVFVHSGDGAPWPPGWEALELHARQALESVDEEQSALVARVEALVEQPGVLAEETSYDDDGALGFEALDLDIDVQEVMRDADDGVAVLREVVDLMVFVEASMGYALDAKFGQRRGTADEARDELEEVAQAYGFSLDREETPDVDFGDGEESSYEDDDESEWGDDEDDAEEEGDAGRERTARAPSSAKVKGRYAQRGGSFGGFDEHEHPPRPSSDPPSAGGFVHAEHFFLAQTALQWPTSPELLRQQWKVVIRVRHPDRAPDDPHAHASFVLLKDGYERLMRRLGVAP